MASGYSQIIVCLKSCLNIVNCFYQLVKLLYSSVRFNLEVRLSILSNKYNDRRLVQSGSITSEFLD